VIDRSGALNGRTVLVVEPDDAWRTTIMEALEAAGCTAIAARERNDALVALDRTAVDVILLALAGSQSDIETFRLLVRCSRAAVIVLTRDDEAAGDVEAALAEGADGYLAKPFSTSLLVARVGVATRHQARLHPHGVGAVLRLGDLAVDADAHQAWAGGTLLSLAPKEFALLDLFLRNAGRVITHEQLLHQLWPEGADVSVLRSHVSRLRRKLEGASPRARIEGIHEIGYRLSLPA
jgi:DNA-binding response OmpR family regulator